MTNSAWQRIWLSVPRKLQEARRMSHPRHALDCYPRGKKGGEFQVVSKRKMQEVA